MRAERIDLSLKLDNPAAICLDCLDEPVQSSVEIMISLIGKRKCQLSSCMTRELETALLF